MYLDTGEAGGLDVVCEFVIAAAMSRSPAPAVKRYTKPGFGTVNRRLTRLAVCVRSAGVWLADTARAAVDETCRTLANALGGWRNLNAPELASFHERLKAAGLSGLPAAEVEIRDGRGR